VASEISTQLMVWATKLPGGDWGALTLRGILITRLVRDHPIWTAAVVTLIFAVSARSVRGVTTSGSVAGALVSFLLYASAGLGAFAALVCVFVVTWIATRYGYLYKRALGTAENQEGRTGSQVVANLFIAAAFAVISALRGNSLFLLATVAALVEAAADTVSSEVGQINNGQVRLITTWKAVPAGTDGGVSLAGTAAGAAAAMIVSGVSTVVKLVPPKFAAISLIAGMLGMIADSYLGALLERRNWLNNNWVNFLSTLTAAGIALVLASV
jgi:uncharacterized protein (TIGR00297 family)